MKTQLHDLLKTALANPSFSYTSEEFIKTQLNAIKDFYEESSKDGDHASPEVMSV